MQDQTSSLRRMTKNEWSYATTDPFILKQTHTHVCKDIRLDRTIQIVDNMGYQAIYSRHHMTNNAVLIPKLQRNFKITSFELSDRYGSLVHLTRYKSKTRNKVLDYRTGQIRPDKELLSYFG